MTELDGQRPNVPDDSPSRLVQDFVEHWGLMAKSWGINATMGELFALLFVTGREMTADELREELKISRGNASMNLRELMNWGVVHRVHHQGQRRDYYRAEGEIWTLFRRILSERKRRELDPTLDLLEESAARSENTMAIEPVARERLRALLDFFRTIDSLSHLLAKIDPADLKEMVDLLYGQSKAGN